ncbi:hypothetical protein [Acinetobacter courvalinii]|uniref:Uncharacterized protein n=1 Tax=Acinetobacter courvalinii TaxID=280147 RepID=A0AA42I8B0_9GAMM|nr:hypothetical protein [Acinetobacter courvalinii]MDH0563960.1 hypothetical protein [Acinetobacter courvalinii]
MENKLQNNFMLIRLLLGLWLFGCLNIIYHGQQQNPYRFIHDTGYVFEYPVKGVILTCVLFSIYFIARGLSTFLKLDTTYPILTYTACSCIVIGQFLIALFGSMHAPPYWAAYLINTVILLLSQLFIIPALLHKKKSS